MKKNNIIIDSAILLSGLTGILYLWGAVYNQGFNEVFGLNNQMMAKEVHEFILDGFAIVTKSSVFVIKLLLIIAAVGMTVFVAGVLLQKQIYKLVSWLSKKFKRKKNIEGDDKNILQTEYFIVLDKIITIIYLSSFFILLFLLLLFKVYVVGKEDGKKLRYNFIDYENSKHQIVTVHLSKEGEKDLFFLGCGKSNCAGIEKGTSDVYFFPQSNGYSYTAKIKQPKGKVRDDDSSLEK